MKARSHGLRNRERFRQPIFFHCGGLEFHLAGVTRGQGAEPHQSRKSRKCLRRKWRGEIVIAPSRSPQRLIVRRAKWGVSAVLPCRDPRDRTRVPPKPGLRNQGAGIRYLRGAGDQDTLDFGLGVAIVSAPSRSPQHLMGRREWRGKVSTNINGRTAAWATRRRPGSAGSTGASSVNVGQPIEQSCRNGWSEEWDHSRMETKSAPHSVLLMAGFWAVWSITSLSVGCAQPPPRTKDLSALAKFVPTGPPDSESVFSELQRGIASDSQFLLWVESAPELPKRLWIARSAPDGIQWSAEVLVDSSRADLCRLVVTNAATHVLYIDHDRISHKARNATAIGHWHNMTSVGREDEAITSFDAIATSKGIIVAYLAYPRSDDAIADSVYNRLVVATIASDGITSYDQIAALPVMQRHSAGPSLVQWNGETHLLCGLSVMVASVDSVSDFQDAYSTRIIHTYLAEGATRWSVPTPLNLGRSKSELRGTAYQIATAANADGIYLFIPYGGVIGLTSRDGRHWGPPIQIMSNIIVDPVEYERTIASSADSSSVYLAWLDRRFRRGGLIPSSPKTADVFVIGGRVSRGDLAGLSAQVPARLTQPGHWPRSVAIGSQGGIQHVYWSELQPLPNGRFPYFNNPRIGTAALSREDLGSLQKH